MTDLLIYWSICQFIHEAYQGTSRQSSYATWLENKIHPTKYLQHFEQGQ
jgi:hypothetical protein